MRQLNLIDDLGWLLDEDWSPTKIDYFTNKEELINENERFDNQWAKLMGYDSIAHLSEHNLKRDRAYYLKYGDRVKGLI